MAYFVWKYYLLRWSCIRWQKSSLLVTKQFTNRSRCAWVFQPQGYRVTWHAWQDLYCIVHILWHCEWFNLIADVIPASFSRFVKNGRWLIQSYIHSTGWSIRPIRETCLVVVRWTFSRLVNGKERPNHVTSKISWSYPVRLIMKSIQKYSAADG